jgi:hypothetical protein
MIRETPSIIDKRIEVVRLALNSSTIPARTSLYFLRDQGASFICDSSILLHGWHPYLSNPRLSFTAEMKSCSAPKYRSVV